MIGGRGLKDGVVEVQNRKDGASEKVPVADVIELLTSRARALLDK